jgi:hypothetical protein
MADKRQKTVSYRRAQWVNEDPASINLAMCIRDAAAKLTTFADRTVARGGGQLVSLAAIDTDASKGHYLHIVADTPGEAASIVPTNEPRSTSINVSTAPPPDNADFMDGDAFLYVRGDDVCLCATSLTDAAVRFFLVEFFRKAKIRKDADRFELIKAANLNKIALVHHQGVREIEIKGTIFKATADYNKRKGQPVTMLSAVSRELKAVLNVPNDVNEDALNVMITLHADKRRKGIVLGEKRLEELSTSLLEHGEDDDDFVIVTKLGQKITQTELFMRAPASIARLGKSVERDDAWKEVKHFYDGLAASGALEG